MNYNCYYWKELSMFLPETGTALKADRTQLDNVDCGAKDSLLQDFGRH